jgi:CRP/FNR family transcriptional regulator, nitrogen oxide reductase regulator
MTLPRVPAGVDFDLLSKIPLFQGLSDAELTRVCQPAHTRKVEEGGFYFLQDDPAQNIFVLLTGRLKLAQGGPEGEQVLMRVVGPYTLFGAVAMSLTETYPVSAQAAEDCTALYWNRQDLMQAVRVFPVLALNAIQEMARHAQEYQERFRQLATERVERRLARTILRLAAQTGRKVPEGVLIDMPLTRQDLAEMTGTTLFTVSRLLKQWEDQGLVISKREQVIIRFPHGLVSIAEDLPTA